MYQVGIRVDQMDVELKRSCAVIASKSRSGLGGPRITILADITALTAEGVPRDFPMNWMRPVDSSIGTARKAFPSFRESINKLFPVDGPALSWFVENPLQERDELTNTAHWRQTGVKIFHTSPCYLTKTQVRRVGPSVKRSWV